MISVSSLREREARSYCREQAFRRSKFVWGYFTSAHTAGAKLPSYMNPLYFRLHFSLVLCDVGV